MNTARISLDEAARSLLAELGGIESHAPAAGQDAFLTPPEPDDKRMAMIDLAHWLTACLTEARFQEGMRVPPKSFNKLMAAVETMAAQAGGDGRYQVRFRGFPTGTQIPPEVDYVIRFGDVEMDAVVAVALFKRAGARMSHLTGRLAKTFRVLGDHGVSSLCLQLPIAADANGKNMAEIRAEGPAGIRAEATAGIRAEAPADIQAEATADIRAEPPIELWRERLGLSLRILSRLSSGGNGEGEIILTGEQGRSRFPIIQDERGRPDVNLTITAAINGISGGAMTAMTRKVAEWMRRNASVPVFSIYDALFSIGKLKNQLARPPIEVNNIKWLAETQPTPIAGGRARPEQAAVARLAAARFGAAPRKAAQVIQSVYGNDYDRVDAAGLGQRVQMASELLDEAAGDGADSGVSLEVMRNIRGRFEQVREDIFDDIRVEGAALRIRDGGRETVVDKIHAGLAKMLAGQKSRVGTRRKIREMVRRPIEFTDADYQAIAGDFQVTPDAARELVSLLRGSFDGQGRFQRHIFEKHIPAFARHEKKVFRFLWHYLKETPHRNDRVAFLNGLQHLILRMESPLRAVDMLMDDLLQNPSQVQFSDRNAMILTTLLLRKHNRDINLFVELTPEEVLNTERGIDREVAGYARRLIDGMSDRVIEKIRAIHQLLLREMGRTTESLDALPPRFLLSLEREIYIFMSIVGGQTARAILRGALKTYGDPDAAIYRMASGRHLEALLNQLGIIIRGLGRIGGAPDAGNLQALAERDRSFSRLASDTTIDMKIRRIMQWAHAARGRLTPRDSGNISFLMAAGTANASAI